MSSVFENQCTELWRLDCLYPEMRDAASAEYSRIKELKEGTFADITHNAYPDETVIVQQSDDKLIVRIGRYKVTINYAKSIQRIDHPLDNDMDDQDSLADIKRKTVEGVSFSRYVKTKLVLDRDAVRRDYLESGGRLGIEHLIAMGLEHRQTWKLHIDRCPNASEADELMARHEAILPEV